MPFETHDHIDAAVYPYAVQKRDTAVPMVFGAKTEDEAASLAALINREQGTDAWYVVRNTTEGHAVAEAVWAVFHLGRALKVAPE